MRLWKLIRQLWRRRNFEAALAEEVSFHREMAGAAFGSVALTLEDSRAVWGFGRLDSLAQDVRYAARGFRKTPGFALTVIGTIGLGLGLNTTLFAVFNAYALRPYALQDPYRLYTFSWTTRSAAWHDFTWPEFQALDRQNTAFAGVLAYRDMIAALNGNASFGQLVTGNYFNTLGAGIVMGRPLVAEDSASAGTGPVMVLSFRAWQNKFGGDPGILGRKVFLRGQPFEVVGVASPEFVGLEPTAVDYWVPLTMAEAVSTGSGQLPPIRMVGRLKRGVTPEAAKTALLAWSRAITAEYPQDQQAAGITLMSRATPAPLTPNVLLAMSPIFAAFALVLLISCANVSNMMLARGLARQREVGIRVSLGAGRARLVRQLLTESLFLALPAAVAGFAISEVTIRAVRRILFATLPRAFANVLTLPDLAPDARVFGFILLASVGATLVFGLAPAIQTTGSSLVAANRGDFSGSSPARLRNALVVTQVTVCVLLLISAAVVLRSEARVSQVDVGLSIHGVFHIQLPAQYHPKAAERLASNPLVESVAAAWYVPLTAVLRQIAVVPSGGRQALFAGYEFVSPEYFPLFRIPLLRGRMFTAGEAEAEAPVAIVSEATARRFWPEADALGQAIALPGGRQVDPRAGRAPRYAAARVIGIVPDVTNGSPASGRDPTCIYFPTSLQAGRNEALLVRVKADPEGARRSLEAALNQVAPSIADQVETMEEVLAQTAYWFRVTFWVAASLGGLALLMTVSGIYGVMSFLVGQRTREIGIRMALGATDGAVVRMVVSQSMRLALLGAAAGAGLALAAAPLFAHELEVVKPYDAVAYAGGAALVLAAALGAAFFPSRRAVRIDPVTTLRCD